jgi:hypothetical protein
LILVLFGELREFNESAVEEPVGGFSVQLIQVVEAARFSYLDLRARIGGARGKLIQHFVVDLV